MRCQQKWQYGYVTVYVSIAIYITNYQETHTHTHTHLTAFCPGLPEWAGTRKVKPIWILLKQETVSGSSISWAICKSAPRSRKITMPAPHHSVFLLAGCPSCRPTNSVKALKARKLNRNVVSCLLKVSSVTSLYRSATGKLFHTTGPLTAKLLSPYVVRVRRTDSRHVLADRRCERPVVNLQYSDRYAWANLWRHLKTRTAVLNVILCQTGSQWS